MSNYPSRILSLYLIGLAFFIFFSCFLPLSGAQAETGHDFTAMQRQARIYRDQGFALQEKGNLEEALAYYQKAIMMDPAYAMVYNDIGIIFEVAGYKDQAKDMYLKAIEVAPDYPNSYSNLAMLYEEFKDYASAIVCWVKRATMGDPNDSWAIAARRRLEEIARVFPKAYGVVGEADKKIIALTHGGTYDSTGSYVRPKEQISLLEEEKTVSTVIPRMDSKSRALGYLNQAKESFSRGEFVLALKDATVAEYLDSSNREISAFVEKVRKALFQ